MAKDPLGRDIGRVSIEEAHRRGLWHEVVYIYATSGHCIMQRRVLEDPRPHGGSRAVWDMSFLVADVLADETPEEAARRTVMNARLRLHGLRRLEVATASVLQQRDSRGRPYRHRTIDYNFVVPCSSLPKVDGQVIRLYPIKDLLNDTCHSRGHAASYGHVHRGPQNREIHDKILRKILLAEA